MLFDIDAKQLARALQDARKFIPSVNQRTLPILQCVLIEADANRGSATGAVTLRATDLDAFGEFYPAATVLESGSVVVNARALQDAAKGLGGTLTLTRIGSGLQVKSHTGASVEIEAQASDEFPRWPTCEGHTAVVLGSDQSLALLDAFRMIRHAISRDETRYNLTGFGVDIARGCIVATDGHRLARASVDGIPLPFSADAVAIIPGKPFGVVDQLARRKGNSICMLEADARILWILSAGFTVAIRLIEGEFPNYTQVLPKTTAERAVFDRVRLRAALDAVAVSAPKKSRATRWVLNGSLVISAQDDETGASASAEVPVIDSRGTELIEWGFNARYVADALDALDGSCGGEGTVALEFAENGATSPIRILPRRSDNPLLIVMPMRIC